MANSTISISNFINRLSVNVDKAYGNTAVTSWSPTWMGSQPTYTQYKYDALVREGYLKCELIFACIDARASTVPSIRLRVYDSNTHEELKQHPLRQLLKRPNPYMSENDFWRQTIQNLDLAGLAAYQKLRAKAGNVVQLWPLRPDYVGIRRGSGAKPLAGYDWNAPGSPPVSFNANDVLLFIERDPRDPFTPVSRTQIAGRIIDVDNSVTDYIKLYWEKGGVPPGVLVSKNKLTPEQITNARKNWMKRYGGYHQWTSPVVLDDDTSYQQTGLSFRDMDFGVQDARSEVRVCTVMKVPPIIVGTTIGLLRNTFSNYQEARKAWWEDMLIPFYNQLGDAMTQDLIPEFESDPESVYLKWDVSGVPALREDQAAKWDRAIRGLAAGGITVNDMRREIGYAVDTGGGDIYLRSSLMTPVPQGQSQQIETTDSGAEQAAIITLYRDMLTRGDAGKARLLLPLMKAPMQLMPGMISHEDVAAARDYLQQVGVTFAQ